LSIDYSGVFEGQHRWIDSKIHATDDKSTKARDKIAEIQRTLSAMEYQSSGTLLKRMKVCGNPRCHCANDPAAPGTVRTLNGAI
jgi:hypothetical protein